MFGEKPRINATVTRKSIERKEELIRFFLKNEFNKINFSIVVDVDDVTIKITRGEYEGFLDYCEKRGIAMRQRRDGIERTYDCTMFGRLCGVGHTNLFITRKGIYPCGRFFGLSEYKLTEYNNSIEEVEKQFARLQPITDGCCYYDTFVRRHK
jgi:uncharacterized protein